MVFALAPHDAHARFTLEHSYGELFAVAHAVAASLRAPSYADTNRVVLAAQSRFAFAAGLFGAWEAGLAVDLPPNVQEATLRDLESRAGALLLHDVPNLPPTPLGEALARGGFSDVPLPSLAEHEELLVLYTSGSTRDARPVVKTTTHLESEVRALASRVGHAGYVTFSSVPLFHLYGLLFGLLVPVAHGGVVVDASALYPSDICRVLRVSNADVFVSTPTHLRALNAGELPAERVIVSSGARLEGRLHMELALQHRARVVDVLGSSETGGIAMRESPMARWAPLPGVRVSSTGANGDQMRVTSPWCGDVVSGDRVRVHRDGTFDHLGRAEGTVKVGGKRIELVALESTVNEVAGVRDVAAFAEDDAQRGARIYVAYASTDDVSEDAVRAAILERFDPVFAPRALRRVNEATLPREATGKLPRATLRALFGLPPLPTADDPGTRELAITALGPTSFRVTLPEDYAFFRGHFDSVPLLAAVVQLSEIVLPLARRAFPELGSLSRARRLRFRRPLMPGQTLDIELMRTADGVKFELGIGGALASSGVLALRADGDA